MTRKVYRDSGSPAAADNLGSLDVYGPITQEEMVALFGETMPMEAAALVHFAPTDMTTGEIRKRLRELAMSDMEAKR
jgi:hypothetical protein